MNNLFTNLSKLVAEDESFFSKDFVLDGRTYRIFNYRLASWTSFQKTDAKWCRGTMFDVTNPQDVKLVCLPPAKFFNWAEGTVNHTESTCVLKMEKLDGSLISTYMHNGELRLKSKGSISSDQAIAAMNWLNRPENSDMKKQITSLASRCATVNMEYCSPTNRIVVPYAEEKLTILNTILHNGETIHQDRLHEWISPEFGVSTTACAVTGDELVKFVSDMEKETVGEGYVLVMVDPSGMYYMVKVKNDRYCQLHLSKDSITMPSRLFDCVIDESTDDLRSMFETDPVALQLIQEMESKVIPVFNHLISRTEAFLMQNKALERKDFAIKAKTEASDIMGLLMTGYLGREIDYKQHAKKFRKELFGIGTDSPTEQ